MTDKLNDKSGVVVKGHTPKYMIPTLVKCMSTSVMLSL